MSVAYVTGLHDYSEQPWSAEASIKYPAPGNAFAQEWRLLADEFSTFLPAGASGLVV